MQDDFGDRMKAYERLRTSDTLEVGKVYYARLDGRGFSKFTKGLQRPYDSRMSEAMIEVTRYLVSKTNANIGYTQSDEISLVWYVKPESEMMFGGKIQKIVSTLASMATVRFVVELTKVGLDDYVERLPHFDCRLFELPSLTEGANAILWREQDASRNAVSMAAHHHFGHKKLIGKNTPEKIAMLAEAGVDFEDYPDFFKRGTFVQRMSYFVTLDEETRMKIPASKRPREGTKVQRNSVEEVFMPKFSTVANRVEVVFNGDMPCGIDLDV